MPTTSPLRGGAGSIDAPPTDAQAFALPRDPDTAQPLANRQEPQKWADPVLSDGDFDHVSRIIAEHSIREKLAAVGLEPSRSLLLSGPPGVGKTMTAQFISSQMKLPLVTVDLAAVMSSYLGRTGRNMRAVLDYAAQNECVLFIDEFDALAKKRDDDSDVGELKRLVNVLLLELDRWPDNRFMIAATNHEDLLDKAISRRFENIIRLPLPSIEQRRKLIHRIPFIESASVPCDVVDLLALATDGMSHSDVIRMLRLHAKKEVVLSGDMENLDRSLTSLAIELLRKDALDDIELREELSGIAHFKLGLSHRKIAALFGLSHPTVSKAVSAYKARGEMAPPVK
ncbi:AAA family ATPase [Kitasatospora sp. cg17-2]